MKLKIGTVCSGIGAPEKALQLLGIDYELAYFCEFDKYASTSYCAIHNENPDKNLGDLTKVDFDKLPKDLDLLVGGTPCQDFSLAGKRAGGEKDSGTRSSLMWNFVEMIDKTKPKAVLWENVPGCLSGKMKATYQDFCQALRNSGYVVHEMRHNAKFFGVPQNRDRVFVLAIRKDQNVQFESPAGYDCGIRLKDILQKEVEPKFYLSDIATNRLFTTSFRRDQYAQKVTKDKDIAKTLKARDFKQAQCVELTKNQPQGNRVYDPNGVSVTLSSQGVGLGAKTGLYLIGASRGRNPEKPSSRVAGEHTEQRLEVGGEISNTLTSVQDRVYDSEGISTACTTSYMPSVAVKERFYQQAFETLAENDCAVGDTINAFNKTVDKTGISPTLTTRPKGFKTAILPVVEENKIIYDEPLQRDGWHRKACEVLNPAGITTCIHTQSNNLLQKVTEPTSYRIRKLTPKECFRLMGFLDEDFYKCQDAGISNSQLYKQAGNSIVVNVLMAIFGQLYGIEWQDAVYGKWKKTEQERNADLPLFALLK